MEHISSRLRLRPPVAAPHLVAPLLAVGCLAVGCLVAALAGCSDGGRGSHRDGRAGASQGASADRQQLLAIGREYSQCVRDHGISDFPDLTVVDGMLVLPDTAPDMKQRLAGDKPVVDECRPILDRAPASARKNAPVSAEDLRSLLAYAQCMREHGVAEWPDPSADGSFPVAGTPLETEGKSTRVVDAMQSCKRYWDKSVRLSVK